jgi:hypothetical protein
VSDLNETKPATASPCLNAATATVTAADRPSWMLCDDQIYMTVSTEDFPHGIQTDCETMDERIELSRQSLREKYSVERKNIGADL